MKDTKIVSAEWFTLTSASNTIKTWNSLSVLLGKSLGLLGLREKPSRDILYYLGTLAWVTEESK